jgi:hypothetical protein
MINADKILMERPEKKTKLVRRKCVCVCVWGGGGCNIKTNLETDSTKGRKFRNELSCYRPARRK